MPDEPIPPTPITEQDRPKTPQPPLDFVQPALAGGMFLGLLSALPIVEIGNAVCCMWVLIGGGMAAILLMKQRPTTGITYGDGAFVGVLSGLFGAVVSTAVRIPMQVITARFLQSQQHEIEDFLTRMGVEGPAKDWALRMASGEVSVMTVLFTFVSYVLVWSLFAMIGGILIVAIMNKRAQKMRGGPA